MKKVSARKCARTIAVAYTFIALICTNAIAAPSKSAPKPAATSAAKSNSKPSPKEVSKDLSAKACAKPGSKMLLWKVSSESGPTLYLLGTIHIFKNAYYPLPDDMEHAFQKARALLVEIDISKSDQNVTRQLIAQKGTYSAGDNITNHISPETTKLLQDYCTKTGSSFASLASYRPWVVALLITQQELQRLGYSIAAGIDRHFIDEANGISKKVIGIETEEFQLGVFSALSEELQDKLLKLTLVDMNLLPQDAGDMMKAWLQGDDVALDLLMTKDVREHPDLAPLNEKLLYERNISMEKTIEAYLKGSPQDVFMVAVGSGHLAGTRSIIDILQQKGFKVEQMKAGSL